MRCSAAVLVGSTAAVLVGSLTGCGQDVARGGAPAPVTSSASAAEPATADAAPAYPTLPAVVVRGQGEMPPPTDDQREWLEQITTHGIPEATLADVQRQEVLMPAFEELRAMRGWAWSDVFRADGWDASVGFAGSAPREALDVLRALPVDVRVVQGVLLTEDQRTAAMIAAYDVVNGLDGVETSSGGADQDNLAISIDYSGREAPDPAALQARALAAARATTDDPVAKDVLDVVVTHRDEPVASTDVG